MPGASYEDSTKSSALLGSPCFACLSDFLVKKGLGVSMSWRKWAPALRHERKPCAVLQEDGAGEEGGGGGGSGSQGEGEGAA